MKKAVEEKKTNKAVEEKAMKKAVEEKKTVAKAEAKPATKKVEEKKPAAKAEVKPAAKKAEEKKPAAKAEVKPAAKKAEEKKPAAKAEDKKAAKAVEKKEEIVITEDNLAEEEVSVTRPGIVEIYSGKDGFYFTFRSFHGFLIGRSQGYTTKDSCKNGVEAVMKACAEAEIYDNCGKDPIKDYAPKFGKAMFEMYKDKAGLFRFRLFAKNSQRVAASEDYKSKANLKSAIGSLKKIAANYKLLDSTLKRKPNN